MSFKPQPGHSPTTDTVTLAPFAAHKAALSDLTSDGGFNDKLTKYNDVLETVLSGAVARRAELDNQVGGGVCGSTCIQAWVKERRFRGAGPL